jgi:iron(II)-dependent oxidoreductase
MNNRRLGLACSVLLATACVGSWYTQVPWLAVGAAAVVCVLIGASWLGRKRAKAETTSVASTVGSQAAAEKVEPPAPVYDDNDPNSLAQHMLDQGRYALLLRPQIAVNLKRDQCQAAIQALDEAMGVVPQGDVLLQAWRHPSERDEPDSQRERLVRVDGVYLDRYPVTNRQFHQFVVADGYQNMQLWDPTIWPAVLDFVDQTGAPGPRFWHDGSYPPELAEHPVVGVSWYEAAAYARWVGKRLPSDPEWVKAGCWPVLTHGTRPMQRRFPWGDTMDRELVNLWGSGPGSTVSVYDLPDCVSVGGVYHLIGNVWEWTTSHFGVWDASARRLETSSPMKSIRGGAFDTYFDVQATCQFQSGESPIRRKHNIGFRCALAVADVVPLDLDQVGSASVDSTLDESSAVGEHAAGGDFA